MSKTLQIIGYLSIMIGTVVFGSLAISYLSTKNTNEIKITHTLNYIETQTYKECFDTMKALEGGYYGGEELNEAIYCKGYVNGTNDILERIK
jgi:hypothetical protein